MKGGDLGRAISSDIAEYGIGPQRRLGWYNRGRLVLLYVARGLAYMHSRQVCKVACMYRPVLLTIVNLRNALHRHHDFTHGNGSNNNPYINSVACCSLGKTDFCVIIIVAWQHNAVVKSSAACHVVVCI